MAPGAYRPGSRRSPASREVAGLRVAYAPAMDDGPIAAAIAKALERVAQVLPRGDCRTGSVPR